VLLKNLPSTFNFFSLTIFDGLTLEFKKLKLLSSYKECRSKELQTFSVHISDDGYVTIDLSRFSFDRFLNKVDVKEELYN
jgi:hypothetical protein